VWLLSREHSWGDEATSTHWQQGASGTGAASEEELHNDQKRGPSVARCRPPSWMLKHRLRLHRAGAQQAALRLGNQRALLAIWTAALCSAGLQQSLLNTKLRISSASPAVS
jgi:hypothetical protein